MALTNAQLTTLKAYIDGVPSLAGYPLTEDGYYDLAVAMRGIPTPKFWVWSTNVDVQDIRDAVVWANLTPTDAPDGTQAWANRALQCQGKQFELQLIIPMNGTLNAAKTNVRSGIQDALQGVRSGPGGVAQDAGWAAVRNVLAREANHVEKALADTTVGNGSTRALAATMVIEGSLSAADIAAARNLV
jgi:hypothetical protein